MNQWTWIKHNNPIVVVVYFILLYPRIPILNCKYAFTSSWMNFVFKDNSVSWVISSKSNICFVIGTYFISFNMSTSTFYQKDALTKVAVDLVIHNRNGGSFHNFDTCSLLVCNVVVLFNSSKVEVASTQNSILLVSFYYVELYSSITSTIVLGNWKNTIFNVLSNLVHDNGWIRRHIFYSRLAFDKFTTFDLGCASFAYLYTRAFYVFNLSS